MRVGRRIKSIVKDSIKIFSEILTNPLRRFQYFTVLGIYNHLSDLDYINRRFYLTFGYQMDWNNPRTFNEKMQWLKIYDCTNDYTLLVDKYEVKHYITEQLGKEYIIPTLGVWNKFEDIDFDKLPSQFVLKCTHDSGGLVIVKNKDELNINDTRKKINKCLKRNYYYMGRELPYKKVKPRIIAEKYMENNNGLGLVDYKFMCFNGNVKCVLVCTDRFSNRGIKMTFYDENWTILPFKRSYPNDNTLCEKPVFYEKMKELAEKLANGIPFLRVDFYEINGAIFFGELTLYPGSGFELFYPSQGDELLGKWLQLPL